MLNSEQLVRLKVTTDVVYDVIEERIRQDTKWGEQNHPDGTGPAAVSYFTRQTFSARHAQECCEVDFSEGNGSYAHILWEEVCEALEEKDKAKLRTEMVQVAAVAVAWIEKLDRELARG